ncbi:MAG: hypothetical protein JO122_04910 [Acetobacteraceae bacterium]|nr:hypothetical protein [Acetobacteraceae bacterium]
MESVEGIVTIVQEGRFQLLDRNGVSHMFVLYHSAPPEPEQLSCLQHDQARVRVDYTQAHDIIGLLAYSITRLD